MPYKLTRSEFYLLLTSIIVVLSAIALALGVGIIIPDEWTEEEYVNKQYSGNTFGQISAYCGCKTINHQKIKNCLPSIMTKRTTSFSKSPETKKREKTYQTIENYPYLVSLSSPAYNDAKEERRFACAGTILSNTWILVGETCVQNEEEWKQLSMRAGSPYWSKNGTVHTVEAVSRPTFRGPVALKVSPTLNFTKQVGAVKLPEKGTDTVWFSAVSAGWLKNSTGKYDRFLVERWTVKPCRNQNCKVMKIKQETCGSKTMGRAFVAHGKRLIALQCAGEKTFMDLQNEEYETWLENIAENRGNQQKWMNEGLFESLNLNRRYKYPYPRSITGSTVNIYETNEYEAVSNHTCSILLPTETACLVLTNDDTPAITKLPTFETDEVITEKFEVNEDDETSAMLNGEATVKTFIESNTKVSEVFSTFNTNVMETLSVRNTDIVEASSAVNEEMPETPTILNVETSTTKILMTTSETIDAKIIETSGVNGLLTETSGLNEVKTRTSSTSNGEAPTILNVTVKTFSTTNEDAVQTFTESNTKVSEMFSGTKEAAAETYSESKVFSTFDPNVIETFSVNNEDIVEATSSAVNKEISETRIGLNIETETSTTTKTLITASETIDARTTEISAVNGLITETSNLNKVETFSATNEEAIQTFTERNTKVSEMFSGTKEAITETYSVNEVNSVKGVDIVETSSAVNEEMSETPIVLNVEMVTEVSSTTAKTLMTTSETIDTPETSGVNGLITETSDLNKMETRTSWTSIEEASGMLNDETLSSDSSDDKVVTEMLSANNVIISELFSETAEALTSTTKTNSETTLSETLSKDYPEKSKKN